MSDYPAEIRNVYGADDYKAQLQNLGDAPVVTKTTNPDGSVSVKVAVTKEFLTEAEIEWARKTLEFGQYDIQPGTPPNMWIGTIKRGSDYTEEVTLVLLGD